MITLDFSALKLTHCARRFQGEVLFNARTPSSNGIDFGAAGNILHYVTEDFSRNEVTKLDIATTAETLQRLNKEKRAGLNGDKIGAMLMCLADMLKQGILKPYQPEGIELYLSKDVTYNGQDITLAGTLDKVYIAGDVLVIRDYKAIWAADYGSRIADYLMSAQIPLYMWLLYNNLDKYPQYKKFFDSGKVQGEFVCWLTGIKNPKCKVSEPLLLELFGLKAIEEMVAMCLHRALDIIRNKDNILPQEGRLNMTCAKLYCPFIHYCKNFSDAQFMGWLNENAGQPYNPATHRER